ncbi:hypothetical protein TYRP_022691 [Tyrophagus putrescentiae]|nr:hypothetical protein TYRP_022691 [Tyrophagus putrescentiae]
MSGFQVLVRSKSGARSGCVQVLVPGAASGSRGALPRRWWSNCSAQPKAVEVLCSVDVVEVLRPLRWQSRHSTQSTAAKALCTEEVSQRIAPIEGKVFLS